MHSLIKKLTKGLGREKQTRYEEMGEKGRRKTRRSRFRMGVGSRAWRDSLRHSRGFSKGP